MPSVAQHGLLPERDEDAKMSDDHDDTYDPRKALLEQVALAARHEAEEEVLGGLIPEMVDEEVGEYDEDLIEELEKHAKRLFKKERAQEAGWRERTVNDNIDDAFAELNERGILALENAGYTQSDGWTEVLEAAAHESSRPRGAIYYSGQDLENAVAGEGLTLAFGSLTEDTEAASVAIAREAYDTLWLYGVPVEWDGSAIQCLLIPSFSWRKRRWTEAPAR
jgi:hypothetical protein